jgi:hypothetical protein
MASIDLVDSDDRWTSSTPGEGTAQIDHLGSKQSRQLDPQSDTG